MTATVTRNLHVSEFKRIHTDAPFRVHVSIGEKCSVTVTGEASALDDVSARVTVRTLNLKMAGDYDHPVTVHVTVPRLERICVAGEGSVEAALRKQSSIDLLIDSEGSGDILVTDGELMFIDADLRGTGNIRARGARAIEGNLHNRGSGKIEATVTYSVVAMLKGAGDINVYGDPRARNLSPKGSGCIYML